MYRTILVGVLKRMTLVLLCFLTVAVFVSCQARGKQSSQEVIAAYLNALSHRDAQAILELTPPDYKAENAVEEKIRQLGGNQFEGIAVELNIEREGLVWGATINATRIMSDGTHVPYSEHLLLEKRSNRWYLILGEEASPGPSLNAPTLIIPSSEQ